MRLHLRALVALLAAAGTAMTAHAASPRICEAGPPLVNGQPGRVWEGDFDGDRKPDRLWVLPPDSGVVGVFEMASDPWTGFRRRFDPARRALVVAQRHRCTLIQHARFFDTPIWEAAEAPLKLLPRAETDTREWRRFTRKGRSDRLLLGTEAGIDVLLYWDGQRWRVAHGTDTP